VGEFPPGVRSGTAIPSIIAYLVGLTEDGAELKRLRKVGAMDLGNSVVEKLY
jgi:hypothetical protein